MSDASVHPGTFVPSAGDGFAFGLRWDRLALLAFNLALWAALIAAAKALF